MRPFAGKVVATAHDARGLRGLAEVGCRPGGLVFGRARAPGPAVARGWWLVRPLMRRTKDSPAGPLGDPSSARTFPRKRRRRAGVIGGRPLNIARSGSPLRHNSCLGVLAWTDKRRRPSR